MLTLTGHITVEWIYGLAILFGLATAFEVPARQAFLVELVPPEDLISAAAINSTTYNMARVIGPAIAGVVVAVAGPGAAFAVNALSYVAVLIGLSRITKVHVPRVGTVRPSVFTGLRFIRSHPALEALAWQMVLLTVFAGSFVPMLSVYARNALHVGSRGYGALTAAVGVGAVSGAIAMGAMGNTDFPTADVGGVVRHTGLRDDGAGIHPLAMARARCARGRWCGDGRAGNFDGDRAATRGTVGAARARDGGLFLRRARAGTNRCLPIGLRFGTLRRGVELPAQCHDRNHRHVDPA